jgi:hypothetical protein
MSKGSFAIDRGIVDVSDDLDESYGWLRVTSGDGSMVSMLSLSLRACEWVRNLSLARIVVVIMGVTSTAVQLEARP